jgi:hypothetical protein
MININMSYIIHRTDQFNAGDWWSRPSHYYPINETQIIDISNVQQYRNLENKTVVLGGGGLLGKLHWDYNLKNLVENNKVILWGAGLNFTPLGKKGGQPLSNSGLPAYLDKMTAVGLRDYGLGYDWVPCASCMHDEVFSVQDMTQTKDVLVVQHRKIKMKSESLKKYKKLRMGQEAGNLKAILTEIKRHNTIITNSYHGAYWGTILKKKVIVQPWGTKFNHLKWKVPFLNEDFSNLDYCMDTATVYPHAWEEALHANHQYWLKIKLLVASRGM